MITDDVMQISSAEMKINTSKDNIFTKPATVSPLKSANVDVFGPPIECCSRNCIGIVPLSERISFQNKSEEEAGDGQLRQFIEKWIVVKTSERQRTRYEEAKSRTKTAQYFVQNFEVCLSCFSTVTGISKIFIRRVLSKIVPE